MKTIHLIFAFIIGLFITVSVNAQSNENQLYYVNKVTVKPERIEQSTHHQTKDQVANELMKIWDDMKVTTKKWDREIAAAMWTNNGINMPIYGVNQNKQEMLDFVENIAINNLWEFVEFKPLELFVHDDMAYEFSLLEHNVTPHDGGETVNTKMRCITVYKKKDGVWKIHRWMPQYSTEL